MSEPIELPALSDEQRQAVEHTGGALMVLAGPGTGKTRVLTARIARLIGDGANPSRIVALTFTNKAAGELRERLGDLVGVSRADLVQAGTFHAWSLSLLRRFADRAGLPARPRVADSAEVLRVLREAVRASALYEHARGAGLDAACERVRTVVEALKHRGMTPEDAGARAREVEPTDAFPAGGLQLLAMCADAGATYERLMRVRGLLAMEDLVHRATALLGSDELVGRIVRADCGHVLVDEFQDVDAGQIGLLREICPPSAAGLDLCVVGDDDQSIYGFRGADDRAFARFESIWHGAASVELTQNRRSAKAVIDAARATIERANARFAPQKTLKRAPEGDEPAPASVEVVRLENVHQSGPAVAAMIERLREEGTPLSNVAVIGRGWTELQRVRGALEVAGIPVEMPERRLAGDDEGVKDVLAWAELVRNPSATWAAVRVLSRPPLGVPALRASEWERSYRAERTRDGDDAESPGFLAWCAKKLPESDPHAPAVARASKLAGEFALMSSQVRADEALERIVRETGAAHADLVTGRARAARVRAIVAMLRFVRVRVGRLDEPKDLRAFLAYRDDLDEREAGFDAEREGSVEGEAAELEGSGVALLTAHGSKGLEFDTVFVSGVQPRGFPSVQSDDPVLPEAMVDRVGDERTAQERADDEERRLFYVACTRAERRLVLLGTVPKGKSRLHFLLELLGARETGEVELIEHEAGDVLDADRDELGGSGELVVATEAGEAALERAVREARLDAAAALGELQHGADDEARVAAAREALLHAGDRLRLAAAMRAGVDEAPAWADGAGLGAQARALIDARSAEAATEDDRLPAPSPPLKLSYSAIDLYHRCPRCYYVSRELKLGEQFSEHAALGNAVHGALESFYCAWVDADSEGREQPGLEALLAEGRTALAQAWPEGEPLSEDVPGRIEAMLRTQWERFHDPGAHVEELEWGVTLPWSLEGHTHSVRVRLDRVERLAGGGALIVDYKTGGASKKLLEPAKTDLQMGLYVLAARQEWGDPELDGFCEYRVLSAGERGRIAFGELKLDKIREQVDKAIRGIVGGEFPQTPRTCTGACALLDRV